MSTFRAVHAATTLALVGAAYLAGDNQAMAGECRDPWVTQAVQEVMGRPPNGEYESGECQYTLYGGGSWSDYGDLVNKVRAALGGSAVTGQCRDPWVTQAIQEVTGRPPNGSYESGECQYTLYGGGSWSDYGDLVNKVRAAFGGYSVQPSDFSINIDQLGQFQSRYNGSQQEFLINGEWYALVAQGGGNWKLISQDGGSIITNAGSN